MRLIRNIDPVYISRNSIALMPKKKLRLALPIRSSTTITGYSCHPKSAVGSPKAKSNGVRY